MLGHTKTRRTEEPFYSRKANAHNEEIDKPMTLDEFIKENFGDLPHWAIALKGLRSREGLSQAALGKIIGTAQTHISQMELGKRPIGKTLAKRLADIFKTDYHLFL